MGRRVALRLSLIMPPHRHRMGRAPSDIHVSLTFAPCVSTVGVGHYQFHKAIGLPPGPGGLTVDLRANSVYVAARNLVFGLTLLTRSRLWAAPQVNPQNLDSCRPCDERAGVQREA